MSELRFFGLRTVRTTGPGDIARLFCLVTSIFLRNRKGIVGKHAQSELEKDLLLAFEEQDKLLSAPAPTLSSPRLWHRSIEPSHSQIDGAGTVRLEELRHGSPLRSQDREEEPQEQ
jgi:hypothetical protein